MIQHKVATMIIFSITLTLTLIVLGIFLYIFFALGYEGHHNTLIGTGIGTVSGIGLSLYIWCNRNTMEH